jgi:8-oxo-dGTP diphosphatase
MPASDQGVSVSRHRYQIIPRVLCFVRHDADLLLIRGAPTKRIWADKYNGLGGHLEPGESPTAAARREIREESGLDVNDLRLRGVVTIQADDPIGIGLYIYTAWAASRDVIASTEGQLEWVPSNAVTTRDLVEDLTTVIPHLLRLPDDAPPFSAHYSYDGAGRLMIRFDS